MPHALRSLAIGFTWFVCASASSAVGFERVDHGSALGHPLEFSVGLSVRAGESVPAECVTAEVVAGDVRVAPALVRTRLEYGADLAPRRVMVATEVRIEEPVVTVTVTLGCEMRMSRRFVILLDPPGFSSAVATADSSRLPDAVLTTADSSAAPGTVAEAQGRPATGSAIRTARPASTATGPARSANASTAAPARPQRPVRAAAAAPARAAAPRLMLESADNVRGASPAATPLLPAAATAAELVVSAQAALDAARLKSLEETVQQFRLESQATRQQLLELQARLREAEAARHANPLVYSLLLVIAVLLLGGGFLAWQLSRRPKPGDWYAAASPVRTAEAAKPVAAAPRDAMAGTELDPDTSSPFVHALRTRVMSDDDFEGRTQPAFATARPQGRELQAVPAHVDSQEPGHSPDSGLAAQREVSVEELIDLEQQVDFFVVLGQDDAAIDLLMSHLRGTGGASPLPYLKLLEIYRRLGLGVEYGRLRERFNLRFNAYVPDWEAEAVEGPGLDGHPDVIARLEQAWSQPAEAMTLLESLLFQRQEGAETFDLTAYAQLLFLYSLARDLAEHHVDPDEIDLLLPLADDFASGEQVLSALAHTEVMEGRAGTRSKFGLDLDIELETAPARVRRS